MKRSIPIILLLLILFLLPSCAPAERFEGGRPVTPEELESISAELFTQGEEPASDTEAGPKYTDREPNTVYWSEGGSVYHKYRDCYHLRDSKSVSSGAVLTARMAGKEKACSECGDE